MKTLKLTVRPGFHVQCSYIPNAISTRCRSFEFDCFIFCLFGFIFHFSSFCVCVYGVYIHVFITLLQPVRNITFKFYYFLCEISVLFSNYKRILHLIQAHISWSVFSRVRKVVKSDCFVISVCPSVRPHGKTRLPLDEFRRNLITTLFLKTCQETLSFIKTPTRMTGTLDEEVKTFMTVSR